MNGFKSDLNFNLCKYNVTGVSIMSVSPGHETAVSWHLKTYKKGINFLCYFVAGLESVFHSSHRNFECKIVNIFLPISFNICFGCYKEPSH